MPLMELSYTVNIYGEDIALFDELENDDDVCLWRMHVYLFMAQTSSNLQIGFF